MTEAVPGVLIFTDDDVVVPSDWITSYVEAYEQADCDAVFGRVLPEWGRENQPEWYDDRFRSVFALLDYGSENLRATSLALQFFGANFSLRTDVLQSVGGFDANLGRFGGKLFIGEETDLFKRLLEARKDVWYFPSIRVWHVIREERKTVDYLRGYYRDAAESRAYLAWKQAKRSILGIPMHVIRKTAGFYIRLPFRWVRALLVGQAPDRLQLGLDVLARNRETRYHFLRICGRGR